MNRDTQLTLSPHQAYALDRFRATAFRRIFQIAEGRLGAGASGGTLEGIASGLSQLLTCRRAGRMAGLGRESARGVRAYNLEAACNCVWILSARARTPH
jgi:hypothetical protein